MLHILRKWRAVNGWRRGGAWVAAETEELEVEPRSVTPACDNHGAASNNIIRGWWQFYLVRNCPFGCFKKTTGPGWCGSVDWVPAWEPKGRQFDSQTGHMPGLWARSPAGMCKRQPHTDVSLPPFLSLSLSKKKKTFKKSIKWRPLEQSS